MFDLGRAAALLWALYVVLRTRRPIETTIVLLACYVFALEIASGFAIRHQGAMEPIQGALLVLMGPSSLPRGRLPALPLADIVVRWPALAHAATAALLALPFATIFHRTGRLRPESDESRRLSRAAVALMLVATLECLAMASRILPYVMSRDLDHFD